MLRPKFAEKSATQRQTDIRNKAKQKRPTSSDAFISFLNSDCSLNLTGAQAAGTYANGGVSTVNNSLYLADVRLPHSISLTMGMGVVVTKGNALSADATLSHFTIPPYMES